MLSEAIEHVQRAPEALPLNEPIQVAMCEAIDTLAQVALIEALTATPLDLPYRRELARVFFESRARLGRSCPLLQGGCPRLRAHIRGCCSNRSRPDSLH